MNTKDRETIQELARKWETEADYWKGRNPDQTLPDMDRETILGELKIAAFLASVYADHARALRGLANGG